MFVAQSTLHKYNWFILYGKQISHGAWLPSRLISLLWLHDPKLLKIVSAAPAPAPSRFYGNNIITAVRLGWCRPELTTNLREGFKNLNQTACWIWSLHLLRPNFMATYSTCSVEASVQHGVLILEALVGTFNKEKVLFRGTVKTSRRFVGGSSGADSDGVSPGLVSWLNYPPALIISCSAGATVPGCG